MKAAAVGAYQSSAVMQQHLRKACGGKFKFFCPVGGKTSWLATITATVWQSYYWQKNALLLRDIRCRRYALCCATGIAVAPETG